MVEQQLYTRVNKVLEGSLRGATIGSGFDTIAATPGLSEDEQIEVENSYNMSISPIVDPVNIENNPIVRKMIQNKNGDIIIGQTVPVQRVHNGEQERTIYLIHCYIIKKENAEYKELLRNENSLIPYGSHFITDYEDDGKAVQFDYSDRLNNGHAEERSFLKNKTEKYNAHLSEMINVLFDVLEKNLLDGDQKRVFITLPDDKSGRDVNDQRVDFLRFLYALLPFEVRGKMGYYFSFTEKAPLNQKIILYFVSETIMNEGIQSGRIGNTRIEYNYVFDFNNERYLMAADQEFNGKKSNYIQFVIENKENPKQLNAYFNFADNLLNENEADNIRLKTYDQLCQVWWLLEGSHEKEVFLFECLFFLFDLMKEKKNNSIDSAIQSVFEKIINRDKLIDLINHNDFIERLLRATIDNKTYEDQVNALLFKIISEYIQGNQTEKAIETIELTSFDKERYQRFVNDFISQDSAARQIFVDHYFKDNKTPLDRVEQFMVFEEYFDARVFSKDLDRNIFKMDVRIKNMGIAEALNEIMRLGSFNQNKVRSGGQVEKVIQYYINRLFEQVILEEIKPEYLENFDATLLREVKLDREAEKKVTEIKYLESVIFDAFSMDDLNLYPNDQNKIYSLVRKMLLSNYLKEKENYFDIVTMAYTKDDNTDLSLIFEEVLCDDEENIFDYVEYYINGCLKNIEPSDDTQNKKNNCPDEIQKNEIRKILRVWRSYYKKHLDSLKQDKALMLKIKYFMKTYPDVKKALKFFKKEIERIEMNELKTPKALFLKFKKSVSKR